MNKAEIVESLEKKHLAFSNDIDRLSDEAFMFAHQSKWTAGQQLKHIVLCISPLAQVFGMAESMIEQSFGTTNSQGRTYQELLSDYSEKLNNGGKAPSQYVPERVLINEKSDLLEALVKSLKKLNSGIDGFSEKQLDTLCIPHPLLGRISLREMLYNAIYHVEHHHEITAANLKNYTINKI